MLSLLLQGKGDAVGLKESVKPGFSTRVIQLADWLAFLECDLNLVTDGRPFA